MNRYSQRTVKAVDQEAYQKMVDKAFETLKEKQKEDAARAEEQARQAELDKEREAKERAEKGTDSPHERSVHGNGQGGMVPRARDSLEGSILQACR